MKRTRTFKQWIQGDFIDEEYRRILDADDEIAPETVIVEITGTTDPETVLDLMEKAFEAGQESVTR